MDDADRARIIDQVMQSTIEHTVTMTFGELFLYHMLLQDFGLSVVGSGRFIPLMERSAARIKSVKEV